MSRRRRGAILVLCGVFVLSAGWLVELRLEDVGQPERDAPSSASPRPTVPPDLDGSALLTAEVATRAGGRTTIGAADDQRPLVVNFWAEWCAPCIAEMPVLEQVRQTNPDVRFVGINEMDQLEQAEAMAERTGITYEWYLDTDGSFAVASQTINLPTTLYLRPDGSVLATRVGAFASEEELQGWLDRARRADP